VTGVTGVTGVGSEYACCCNAARSASQFGAAQHRPLCAGGGGGCSHVGVVGMCVPQTGPEDAGEPPTPRVLLAVLLRSMPSARETDVAVAGVAGW